MAIAGLKITNIEGIGRTLQATKSFSVGDIVLEERPLLVYPSDDLQQMLILFSQLADVDKETLLDFQSYTGFEQARFSEFKRELDRVNQLLATESYQRVLKSIKLSESMAFRLMSISHINSHSFTGAQLPLKESFSHTGDSPDFSAFFVYGSKAAHSCAPNCNYSSKNVNGSLVYYAIRPIKEGDVISFSYLDLFGNPTYRRRKALVATKDFFCACAKCSGPDLMNGYPCGTAAAAKAQKCTGTTFCCKKSDRSEIQWTCNLCGDHAEPNTAVASAVQERFDEIKALAEGGELSPSLCKRLDALITEAVQSLLSPTHHLVIEMLLTLSRFHASGAAIVEEEMPRMAAQFRQRSADTTYRAVLRLECMAEGCLRGDGCGAAHPPALDCGSNIILWACMDLMKCESPLPRWLQRYLPLLQWDYGSDDSDIQDILRYIQAGSSSNSNSSSSNTTTGVTTLQHRAVLGGKGSLSQASPPPLSLEEAEERAEASRRALLEELDREEANKADTASSKQKKKNKPKKKK